jgi:hypothetical protein
LRFSLETGSHLINMPDCHNHHPLSITVMCFSVVWSVKGCLFWLISLIKYEGLRWQSFILWRDLKRSLKFSWVFGNALCSHCWYELLQLVIKLTWWLERIVEEYLYLAGWYGW